MEEQIPYGVTEATSVEGEAGQPPVQKKSKPNLDRYRQSLRYKDVLTYRDQDPDYVYRVANDDPTNPGRVQSLEEAGWEIVHGEKKLGDPSQGAAGLGTAVTKHVGGGVTGVLMRKRKDWYDHDMQRDYYDEADRKEEEILRQVKKPGMYGSVTIGNKTVTQAPRR